MSTQKPLLGASTTLGTTGLTTLASSATAGWQSDAITPDAAGVAFTIAIQLASGTVGADKTIYVYAYESEDGTTYTDNATGSAGTLTRRDPTNFRLLDTIATPDNTGTPTFRKVIDYAPLVPKRKVGLYVNNVTNLAFQAATITYTPVQGQST